MMVVPLLAPGCIRVLSQVLCLDNDNDECIVDLQGAQDPCTLHAHGAVTLSKKHSKKKKGPNEIEKILEGSFSQCSNSIQHSAENRRVFMCLRKI